MRQAKSCKEFYSFVSPKYEQQRHVDIIWTKIGICTVYTIYVLVRKTQMSKKNLTQGAGSFAYSVGFLMGDGSL